MAEEDGSPRFCRATLVAAAEFLAEHTQASFNQMVVRLELEHEIPEDEGMSVNRKCAQLGRIVVKGDDREVDAHEGRRSLAEAVILEAAALAENGAERRLQTVFEQALARDGYALSWEEQDAPAEVWGTRGRARLVAALPPELAAARPDDEIHALLATKNFKLSAGHLDQALFQGAEWAWIDPGLGLRGWLPELSR